jgi:hypothetical protein
MFHAYRAFRLHRPHRRGGSLLGTLAGAALIAGMLVFGVVALLVIAAVGAAVWLTRQLKTATQAPSAAPPPPGPAGVIEGEFVVVRDGPRVTQG